MKVTIRVEDRYQIAEAVIETEDLERLNTKVVNFYYEDLYNYAKEKIKNIKEKSDVQDKLDVIREILGDDYNEE